MTKVNPNNGNERKSNIFFGTFSKLKLPFIGQKILKYFKDFYSWNLFNIIAKVSTNK